MTNRTDSGGSQTDGGRAEGGSADAIAVPDVLEEPPPTCSGQYACVPAVPAGWVGPLEVYAGPGQPPPCSPLFQLAEDANDQLQAPPASCGCACGAPAVSCTPPPITFYVVQAACMTNVTCATINLPPSGCTTVDERSSCTAPYMSAPAPVVVGAGCQPQASQTIPPTTWGTSGRACISTVAPSQVDCAAGSVCAPKPAPPFGASACIAAVGDSACPLGPYAIKHAFFTDVTDTRACSACTCGPATNPACTATIHMYPSSNQSCSGTAVSVEAPFACDAVDQPADFSVTLGGTADDCAPSQGTPTGAAIPAKPVTVCCTQ